MTQYRLTHKAENDIESIYEYSILNFGLEVARVYVAGMHECFGVLAENQSWGSDYSAVKSGVLRYEYRSHSVYYQKEKQGILIIRVLGRRQSPALHV